MAFVPDPQPAKLRFVPDKPAAASTPPATFGNTLGGEAELLGAGVGNIIPAALNAGIDLVSRATGHGPHPGAVPEFQVGEAGKNLVKNVGGMLPSTENGLDVSDQELRESLDPTGKVPIEQLRAQYKAQSDKPLAQQFHETGTPLGDLAGHVADVGGDVANVLPGAALAKSGVQGVLSAVRTSAENASAPWRAAGFRNATGVSGATGKVLAGDTTKATLVNHNAQVGNVIGAAEANVPHGAQLGYDTLATAREGPSAVLDRAGDALPAGGLDDTAAGGIRSAGLPEGGRVSQGSPQAQAHIETLRNQLLSPTNANGQPWTGRNWVNEMRGLRQEGFTNIASDDVSNQQLGHAQLDMARAIEGHFERNLPINGDVSIDQFRDARKALAKNFTVQGALRGNDIDLNAIARAQRADPQLLDGGLKVAADFANANREAVGLPTRINAPGIAKDISNVNPLKLGSVASLATAGTGPALGRRLLTGGTPSVLERTQRMFSAQPDRFSPLPSDVPPMPMGPPEPDFTTGIGANPNPTAPAGRPGDFSLADLLSHGVEQSPPAGLSAGPMGAPAPEGIPFRVNAEHAAGGLEAAPTPAPAPPERLGDLAAVMSQGVPEGTMTRTPPNAARGTRASVEFPSGAQTQTRASKPLGARLGGKQRGAVNFWSGLDQDEFPLTPNRTATRSGASMTMDDFNNAYGRLGDELTNNGSSPGAEGAGSVEAQNRVAAEKASGSAPFEITPDGTRGEIAHTVDAVDRPAPKGHLKVQVDPSDGKLKIIDRGGLKQSAANGLLARYQALSSKLGDEFK